MKTKILKLIAFGAILLPNSAYTITNTVNIRFDTVNGPCAKYKATGNDWNCMICVPYQTSDAMGMPFDWQTPGITWANSKTVKDQCAEIGCTNFPDNTDDLKNYLNPIGTISNYDATFYNYQCHTDGWQKEYVETTQAILTKYNGRYETCKNPRLHDDKQWTCDSYTSAYCNNGYYGTYQGRPTDCTPCPDIPARYAINGSADNPTWYQARQPEPGQSNHDDDIGNKTITGCYIDIQSNAAPYMKDDTGYYQITDKCYYSN